MKFLSLANILIPDFRKEVNATVKNLHALKIYPAKSRE